MFCVEENSFPVLLYHPARLGFGKCLGVGSAGLVSTGRPFCGCCQCYQHTRCMMNRRLATGLHHEVLGTPGL